MVTNPFSNNSGLAGKHMVLSSIFTLIFDLSYFEISHFNLYSIHGLTNTPLSFIYNQIKDLIDLQTLSFSIVIQRFKIQGL